jgi:hypothetical protein
MELLVICVLALAHDSWGGLSSHRCERERVTHDLIST